MVENFSSLLTISVARAADRKSIYRLRHEVYASELGQYDLCEEGSLPDSPEVNSVYLIATHDGRLVGFIGITPPSSPRYSIDRYLSRAALPLSFDNRLYEIRALTVERGHRGAAIAGSLMYAAFRWVQSHGGETVASIGRREVLGTYLKLGLKPAGISFKCGAVTYDLISATIEELQARLGRNRTILQRMERRICWELDFPFFRPSDCYHGGAFFEAIGDDFKDLSKSESVISADVLDAWFDPAPLAQEGLLQRLPWIMKTSPPTRSEGLVATISEMRGIPPQCILSGGGSSDLIFLAFLNWLNRNSRVLVLDPTYGEYLHVLERILQCKVERFHLDRKIGYKMDLERLEKKLDEGFDLFVWVNPNSPTGLHVEREPMERLLRSTSCRRVWVDETYIEYVGREHSLEPFAAQSENVIVCKSMSKVYALSGLRVAYLCAAPHQLERLRSLTPPWAVSLPAQIAAVKALRSEDYYEQQYRKTRELREELIQGLRQLGIDEIIPGVANFVLFHLPEGRRSASSVVNACRDQQLYLRNVEGMGTSLGENALRIAVKDRKTNLRMLNILKDVLSHQELEDPSLSVLIPALEYDPARRRLSNEKPSSSVDTPLFSEH